MKKFFTYPVFVFLFISFIGMMGFGAIVKYNFEGGEKYQFLQKQVMLISSVPITLRNMIKHRTLNLNKLRPLPKHKDKKRFEQFIENKRNALLVLPRYEYSLGRSVVDIIDLNDFEVIHTYQHHISEMNEQVQNTEKFPRLNIDHSPTRFLYGNALILNDGSLISNSNGPIFKIDFCSNLKWVNDEEKFNHSINFGHDGNIWQVGELKPYSKYVKRYQIKNFKDFAIIKINSEGKILFKKSVIEILIENKILPENYAYNAVYNNNNNPIHLNDIQPVFSDTEYWKKGDLFLSIRNQSAIIHYRPSTNKVINYLTGPFARQHDVDIISEKEISIFDNNNFFVDNQYSEVLIYNFETNKFKKLFNDQLQKENFKTLDNGLSHILNDGALMVEEQNHGRIILFNNKGQKEWEFVNKDNQGKVSYVKWSRIIEDKLFIEKFKSLVENKKCIN